MVGLLQTLIYVPAIRDISANSSRKETAGEKRKSWLERQQQQFAPESKFCTKSVIGTRHPPPPPLHHGGESSCDNYTLTEWQLVYAAQQRVGGVVVFISIKPIRHCREKNLGLQNSTPPLFPFLQFI